MNSMELLPSNHPLLKTVCRRVTPDDDITFLCSELHRICTSAAGLGLAANQIGSDLRVFVIDNRGLKTYINPEIVETSGELSSELEGCLSFPGEIVYVRRYSKVILRSDSRPDEILTGIAAIAAQHELDHLDGITMHDRSLS